MKNHGSPDIVPILTGEPSMKAPVKGGTLVSIDTVCWCGHDLDDHDVMLPFCCTLCGCDGFAPREEETEDDL